MFVKDAQICDYADDTTIFAGDSNIGSVDKTLDSDAHTIAEWYPNDCNKQSKEKCHLVVFGNKSNDIYIYKAGKRLSN